MDSSLQVPWLSLHHLLHQQDICELPEAEQVLRDDFGRHQLQACVAAFNSLLIVCCLFIG
jgi:hypothetical protein